MFGKLMFGNLGKVLMTLLVIGVSGSTVSYGTFATFTAQTTNPSNTFATGTLVLTTSSPAAAIMTISALKPGDSIARPLTLSNTGSINSTYTLTTTAPTSTLLDTDTTNGLKLEITRCTTGAWSGGPPSYTCTGGGSAVVLGPVSIIQAAQAIGSLNASSSDNLLVKISLPSGAGNTFQNLSSTILFTWDATQVAGAAQ